MDRKVRTEGLKMGDRSRGRLGEENGILLKLHKMLRRRLENGEAIVLLALRVLITILLEETASRHGVD